MVDELRRKCEEYKKDIEARNSTIFSIQRNFESLSGLLKTEKTENQQMREDFKRLKEENISFLI